MMRTLWKSRFHEEYQRYHVRFTLGQVVVLLESIGATDLIKHPDQVNSCCLRYPQAPQFFSDCKLARISIFVWMFYLWKREIPS